MKILEKIFKDCLTQNDGKYIFEHVAVLLLLIIFSVLASIDVFTDNDFHPRELGEGLGYIFGAGGLATWLKGDRNKNE